MTHQTKYYLDPLFNHFHLYIDHSFAEEEARLLRNELIEYGDPHWTYEIEENEQLPGRYSFHVWNYILGISVYPVSHTYYSASPLSTPYGKLEFEITSTDPVFVVILCVECMEAIKGWSNK